MTDEQRRIDVLVNENQWLRLQMERVTAERDEWRAFGSEALTAAEELRAQRDTAVASVAALLDAYIAITPGATVAGLAPQVQADAERLLGRLDAMETALRTARDFAWYWPAGGPRDTVLAAIDAALAARE